MPVICTQTRKQSVLLSASLLGWYIFVVRFFAEYVSKTDKIQKYRKKSPQRILRLPLPSKTGPSRSIWLDSYEDDMLPYEDDKIHIQWVGGA